jgi:hypothetical protein
MSHPKIELLRDFQTWRSGGDKPQMKFSDVTDLLVWAIQFLESADHLINDGDRFDGKNFKRMVASRNAR